MKNKGDIWLKEIIFGLEDGMVSTLGALTGIAVGALDHKAILLAGIVVITVESISMGVGSFLSNRSVRDLYQKRIDEKKINIDAKLEKAKTRLYQIYVCQGWPKKFAREMVKKAASRKKLLFNEMLCHELGLQFFDRQAYDRSPWGMFCAYILGGMIPLSAYIIFDWQQALWLSIIMTLSGLFILGAVISRYTQVDWFKNGLRVLLFGGLALIFGVAAGYISRSFI